MKHPIVGDPIYGENEENIVKFLDKVLTPAQRIENGGAKRLLLHASELEFELYGNKYHIKSNIDFEKVCLDSLNVSRET